MTPKEKAQELFDKFIEFTQDWDELDGYVDDEYRAKQCALIAVDEKIKYTKEIIMIYDLSFDVSDSYWIQVKQEIEKL
jgi:hypothetical protein